MTFTDIMGLLKQGLTYEQVQQIIAQSKQNEQNTQQGTQQTTQQTTQQATQQNTQQGTQQNTQQNTQQANDQPPAWAEQLNKNISELTRTMQANALYNTNQSGGTPMTIADQADNILANILNPEPPKKSKGV